MLPALAKAGGSSRW